MNTVVSASETYFSVAVTMLHPPAVAPCDVWVRTGSGEPRLFCAASTPLTAQHRQKLIDAGIETVLVRFDDAASWNGFLERGLRDRINDPSRPVAERTQLLLDTARPLMKEVLENPQARGTEERVGHLADSLCDLLRLPEAVGTAIRLMEHDYYTYTHSLHVAIYSVALARAAGLDAPDLLASIGRGGLVHDCGKCRLPAQLINKPGRLSETEWQLMRSHPQEGVRVLRETGWIDEGVIAMCADHHERLDGSGYPRGLIGQQIAAPARIAAIADAFDAMTTDRSYQKGRSGHDALKVLRQHGQATYDQRLLECFIRLLLARS